ncbi:MAG: immunoglobulin-like domain-containing protein [Acutalibacteraceae bacterium]
MKKTLSILIFIVIMITAAACNSSDSGKKSNIENTTDESGVALVAEKESYPLNTEKIIAIWQNNGDEEIGLGYAFELEKETNGNFESVKPESEVLFDLPLIKLSKNERKEIEYSIDNYKLESGTYRIKTEYIKNKKQIPIYCEFILK